MKLLIYSESYEHYSQFFRGIKSAKGCDITTNLPYYFPLWCLIALALSIEWSQNKMVVKIVWFMHYEKSSCVCQKNRSKMDNLKKVERQKDFIYKIPFLLQETSDEYKSKFTVFQLYECLCICNRVTMYQNTETEI